MQIDSEIFVHALKSDLTLKASLKRIRLKNNISGMTIWFTVNNSIVITSGEIKLQRNVIM